MHKYKYDSLLAFFRALAMHMIAEHPDKKFDIVGAEHIYGNILDGKIPVPSTCYICKKELVHEEVSNI